MAKIEDFLNLDPELAEKLRRRGYGTVEAIASARVSELTSRRYGITKTMAKKLKSAARKAVGVDFKQGDRL
ncbi:MAG: hypothetical protein KKE96_03570 [Candidatus Altiarchaeota archaeon]|nr:hypothetical protein [Candidatus Altiarchaeota archaeon]